MTNPLHQGLVTGALAAMIVFVADWAVIPGWVAFLAWTAQNLLDREGISSWQALLNFAVGITVAILSIAAMDPMPILPGSISPPAAIGGACAAVVLLARHVKPQTIVPAVFLGMIAWFGTRGVDQAPSAQSVLAAHVLGLAAYHLSKFTPHWPGNRAKQ